MIKLTFCVSLMSASTSKAFYDLAFEHGGYFTTREALQGRLSYRRLSNHVLSGELDASRMACTAWSNTPRTMVT
jgi:hypothetical protein